MNIRDICKRASLGPYFTAILAGSTSSEIIDLWVSGSRTPSPSEQRCLRFGLQMLEKIMDTEGPERAAAWLAMGDASDFSPAAALGSDQFEDVEHAPCLFLAKP
jgi:hypothetical protein